MHKSFEKDHSQKIIFLNKKFFQNSIIWYFYQINEPLVESSQNNAASK